MLCSRALQRWLVSPPEGKLEASGSPFISSLPENSIITLPSGAGDIKAVVLFGGDTCERLEPMGKVCSSVGDCPVLHSVCNGIGNLGVEPRALVNRLFKRAVDIGGKVRLHNSVVENHAAKDF